MFFSYVTVESLKNKIVDKNNGNFNDLNDWEYILKLRVNNRIRAMKNSHTMEQFRYGIDQGWANFSVQGPHSKFHNFIGLHIILIKITDF